MGTVIYYFTGRGNSLSVARGLAGRLPDARIESMSSSGEEINLADDYVGLALPVIDFGIPAYVRRFVRRLNAGGKTPHVFAVITCGGMPGASALQLKKELGKRGLALASCRIVKFGLEKRSDEEWRSLLDTLAEAAMAKAESAFLDIPMKDKLMTGLGNPLARLIIPGEDRKFRVDASCTGCGVCAKVCPVKNIRLTGGKPQWLHRCEQCAACFSWCPKAAISGTCLAARTHYTSPLVKLEQMTGEK
jgi:ferredoxin